MKRLIISSLAVLAMTSTAFAQSTITGSLTGGGTGTSSSGSSLSGTVGTSSNTLTGTVVSTTPTAVVNPSASSGGGGGGGTNVIDICPNLPGTQSTLPSGYILLGGNCVLSTSSVTSPAATVVPATNVTATSPGIPNTGVSTSNASTPGIPNTGENGLSATITLITSGILALGAALLLKRRIA